MGNVYCYVYFSTNISYFGDSQKSVMVPDLAGLKILLAHKLWNK